MIHAFNILIISMAILGLIVFISLHFVTAGYGKFATKKWGPSVNNKAGWIIMESPVFILMLVLWLLSPNRENIVTTIFLIFFQMHYFQRSFIFPFLLKGNSKMPLSIIAMGIIFNTINALMQGGWLFYLSPKDMYSINWLSSPQFIAGTMIFFAGMYINISSDSVIRHLRKPGDTNHYLPQKGMYRYVTSANYFGEIVEWTGFAILTWSISGAIFAWWTFANLVPRAASIYQRYLNEFGPQMKERKLKRVFPFIY